MSEKMIQEFIERIEVLERRVSQLEAELYETKALATASSPLIPEIERTQMAEKWMNVQEQKKQREANESRFVK